MPSCDCLPPTTACCEGGFSSTSLIQCASCGEPSGSPIIIIITLVIMLALLILVLIGIMAFFIYRLVSFSYTLKVSILVYLAG